MLSVCLFIIGCLVDPGCDDIAPGQRRDMCLLNRVLGISATDLQHFVEQTQTIDDPLVRSAAVMDWVARNGASLTPDAAARVCQILPPGEQLTCIRRATAVHLRR